MNRIGNGSCGSWNHAHGWYVPGSVSCHCASSTPSSARAASRAADSSVASQHTVQARAKRCVARLAQATSDTGARASGGGVVLPALPLVLPPAQTPDDGAASISQDSSCKTAMRMLCLL